jgi:hypothetical protein
MPIRLSRNIDGRAPANVSSAAGAEMLQPDRSTLSVGSIHDPLEREADRLAARALANPTASIGAWIGSRAATDTRIHRSSSLRRAGYVTGGADLPADSRIRLASDRRRGADVGAARADAEGGSRIRRSAQPSGASVGADGGRLDSAIEGRIRRASGRPIDERTNSHVSAAFGRDLSGVRIHTGAEAADLNRSLGARAFTLGSQIFFGAGEYRPNTADGSHLLAHELAHTVQQSDTAQRAPVVRRVIKVTADPEVAADTTITEPQDLINVCAKANRPFNPKADPPTTKVLGRWMRSSQELTFPTVQAMLTAARAQSVELAQTQTQIDPFTMKATESRKDDPVDKRSLSATSRYDFRNNDKAALPDAGPDPTEKAKARNAEVPAYYYHITSYSNLKKIFAEGLNPAAGGAEGGSSFQSADAKMNQASANDSKNKVFVATVGKLTERYLSLRLRQNDLFERHGECIVAEMDKLLKLGDGGAQMVFAQICLGEEAVTLRFKNSWAIKNWEHDPIEKKAYALKGTPVPPAQIECLSIGGWAQLDTMVEVANAITSGKDFDQIRQALLAFYGQHNEKLAAMSGPEGWSAIPALLTEVFKAKKLVT